MLKAEKRRGGRLRGVGGREDGVEGGEQVAGRTGCWGPLAGAKRRCLSGVVSQVLTRAVPRLYSHHSAPVPAAGGVQAVRLSGRMECQRLFAALVRQRYSRHCAARHLFAAPCGKASITGAASICGPAEWPTETWVSSCAGVGLRHGCIPLPAGGVWLAVAQNVSARGWDNPTEQSEIRAWGRRLEGRRLGGEVGANRGGAEGGRRCRAGGCDYFDRFPPTLAPIQPAPAEPQSRTRGLFGAQTSRAPTNPAIRPQAAHRLS